MDLCNINVIRALLEGHGFKFSKAMGQNFLIAPWVPAEIAAAGLADKNSGVLEIGPGVGCLTKELSDAAGKVCAVELDKRLPEVLEKSLRGCENVEIFSGDIMKFDLDKLLSKRVEGLTQRVCATLPYNITSPVLTKLIEYGRFETITVMIQKEVARRIYAAAGSDSYGAFSVFIQYHTVPELLFDVPPDCFVPQPKVTSSVIRLKTRKTPPVEVCSEKLLFRTVRAAFSRRRKTLLNGLSMSYGEIPKEEMCGILEKCGFDPKVRGETLSLEDFAALTNGIGEVLNGD